MHDTTELAAHLAANVARETMGLWQSKGKDTSTRHFSLSSPEVAYQSFDEAGRVIADFDSARNVIDATARGKTSSRPDQNKTTSERTHFAKDAKFATAIPTSELTSGKMIQHSNIDYLVIACPTTTSDAIPVSLGPRFTPEPTPYLWLIKLASKYAEHIGMPPSHRYIFASLPEGYFCASKLRKDTNTLRQSMFGSRSGTFESVEKFWPHFVRLLEDGYLDNCECVLCLKMRVREERERRRELERFEKKKICA